MMSDPLSDLIVRIKNGAMRGFNTVKTPASTLRKRVLEVLKSEGFIANFTEESVDGHPVFLVQLRYIQEGQPMITGMKRISKPSLRVYVGKGEIGRVKGGLGISILSTSKGIMTDQSCRAAGIGGEVLCQVW